MTIPGLILKQLYTFGSLKNLAGETGVQFAIKNRLSDTSIHSLDAIRVAGNSVDKSKITLKLPDGSSIAASDLSPEKTVAFPLAAMLMINLDMPHLPIGKHSIDIDFVAEMFGALSFSVEDTITEEDDMVRIPRNNADDYGDDAIKARQKFIEEQTDAKLEHVSQYSLDPHTLQGNIENFTGIAQIPIGFAGPISINGEHAQGEFLIPMATTEGTLVASYNRGIKVANLSGGIRATVVDDAMQRAPVFVFDNARDARDFMNWVEDNLPDIREHAEATSSVAKLQSIDPYLFSKFVYLRFNYSTGDAAGQNMVGRATFAACSHILEIYPEGKVKHFYLESNFATDKKASQVNILRTRGKRVTAEAIVKRDVLLQHMRVETEGLHYHYGIATLGSFLSGANNNGAHSPNAITAMFIATGQDVANVAESSAGVLYSELLPNKDLYISLTIPSLIVATYGGGTGLSTQSECLSVMGCVGRDKVRKLAEIVAAVALAGEISLAAAISSSDWVSSHEQYGRNR
ncbi:MAG: hydroxymethylglutaryl-CoA reductase [Aggregatilineales bacterium]